MKVMISPLDLAAGLTVFYVSVMTLILLIVSRNNDEGDDE